MGYTVDDHTFAICAYRESPYLEDCILSLLNQTKRSKILIVTSTPCQFIAAIAEKYHLPLFLNQGESGIAGDWNFGYHQANTPLVTITHQDDIYQPEYAEHILALVNCSTHPLIAFTDYAELRGDDPVYTNTLLKIKRILLLPLRMKALRNRRCMRRMSLAFGCGICCPSVTYVRPNLPPVIFQSGYRSDLDWQAWERLSRLDGEFLYCPEALVLHRIHEDSETTHVLADHQRGREDYEMFCKFWPSVVAKALAKVYSTAEKSNHMRRS